MTPGPWRLFALAAALLAGALLLACGGSSGGEPSRSSPPASPPTAEPSATQRASRSTATPAPTEAQATPHSSATEGAATAQPAVTSTVQPAAALVPAFPGLPELERPVALIDVPRHDLFLIVLQEGRVLSVPRGGPYDGPRTVHDQRETTICCREEGLLSIALDPDFAGNGHVYAYYSAGALKRTTRLVRFETTGEGEAFAIEASSELLIYEMVQPYTNHNGGTILFGPDGMLYLGFGDGGHANDPRGHGQNLATALGTVIRIDVRGASPEQPYAIPPDNPFLDRDGALPETWAYGLRNPWRMTFDRETGSLWVGDVGQNLIEEVSVIEAGGNYGWNVMEGSRCSSPATGCDRTGLTLPVWEYSHEFGCSITGGYVYRGEALPALRGWYLYSDYCSGGVWAIHAETAATGGYLEPVLLWAGGPNEVVSFAEDAGGELYVISHEGDRIYRIVAQ